MCLIAFALGQQPGLPLLLAANRDEFFDRPTAHWGRWTLPDGTAVLGGRDLRGGGTWLGVSLAGRVAMLTNVRGPQAATGLRSRGELVTRWLADEPWMSLETSTTPPVHGGFNLVVGDLRTGAWHWLSNSDAMRPHDGVVSKPTQRSLGPGVYGLSNAALDTPWPKTVRLKAAVAAAARIVKMDSSAPASPDWASGLARALADHTLAPIDQLPSTGIEPTRERHLSSAFVRLPEQGYGTRSSLVLRIAATKQPGRWFLEAQEWTHRPPTPGQPHRWDSTQRQRESVLLGTQLPGKPG